MFNKNTKQYLNIQTIFEYRFTFVNHSSLQIQIQKEAEP